MQKNAEIHFLTKKPFAPILNTNPHISKVYTINKKVSEITAALRQEKYDYIIDLHHNLRSFLVKSSLPFVKSYAFNKLNFVKWLLTNFKINQLPKKHIVDRYLETVKPLGVENDGKGLDFFVGQDMPKLPIEQSGFQNLAYLKRYLDSYIALPIGAGRNTKALTVEIIVTICQSIDYPIVLLGGKQEIKKAEQIIFPFWEKAEGNLTKPLNVVNLVGKCSLLESAAIVKNAKVVLTGDTGLMHIAAAFHKPIVSIWGNTIHEFGMYPYYPKGMDLNSTLEVKNLPCRPCSKIGYDNCPKGHFKCIKNITAVKIIASLNKILKTS